MPLAPELWTVFIPTLAFENICLMDGILACTALQMRISGTQDNAIVQASHKYMARAIRSYIRMVQTGINTKNFDALYMTAMLIAFHTFLSRRFNPDSITADTIPLQWFQPFQGIKILANANAPVAAASRLGQVFPGWRTPLGACGHERNECTFGFLLDGLAHDEKDYGTYSNAVSHMCNVLHCRQPRFFVRFLTEAPARLVELLKARDPRSLVIVGTFFTLMKSVDKQIWWLHGCADRESFEIQSVLPQAWIAMFERAKALVLNVHQMCTISSLHIHCGPGNEQVMTLQSRWKSDGTDRSATWEMDRD